MESPAAFIIRGVLSVMLGIVAIFWPGITLTVFVLLFGAFVFADGVVSLIRGFTSNRIHGRSWVHALLGLLGIAVGVLTFMQPGLTLLVLVMYIAAWAIVRGVLELVAAVRLRRVITGEWLLALSGVLSLVFGFLVFAFPGAGALTIAWLFGIYAIAAGIVLMMLGFRLRRPLPV
jgi:uncharacterized membrane protein HdeD (DUF308 family)